MTQLSVSTLFVICFASLLLLNFINAFAEMRTRQGITMDRVLLTVIALLLGTGSHLQAQEFVAVKVEAENFVSKHADWRTTTTSSTPDVRPDPDGSHAGSASGRAYMELLPDTRVTHSDSLIANGNFWSTAGTGPSLSYNVNIPEPGRYIVFVLSLIHI